MITVEYNFCYPQEKTIQRLPVDVNDIEDAIAYGKILIASHNLSQIQLSWETSNSQEQITINKPISKSL